MHQLQVLLEEEFRTEVAALDPVDLSRTPYQLAILSNTTFVVTNLGIQMAEGRHLGVP